MALRRPQAMTGHAAEAVLVVPGLPGRANSQSSGLLRILRPELFAQLHPTLNEAEDLKNAETITCASSRVLWWLCTENCNRPAGCTHEHAWQASVGRRCLKGKIKGNGCPFCWGRRVCPCSSLAHKEPCVVQFWHPSRRR